jgi:hypothetical protein
MSGLVLFPNYHDYNLFLKKYEEFCSKQMPYFECLPYEMPITPNEENNFNNNFLSPQINKNNMLNQYNQPQYIQNQNNFRMMNNNNIQRRYNGFANANMGMIEGNNMNMRNMNNPNNFNNRMPMNAGLNYMNTPIQKNYKYAGNDNNMQFKNNNGMPYNKNNKFNNNKNGNNNRKTIIQRPKPNQKVIYRQNYGNSYNININMNQNMMTMNPIVQQQMLAMVNQNKKKFNNRMNNNMRQQMTPMNYQNNFNNFPNKNNFNDSRNENYRNKNDPEYIDQRNLQNLNPSQLQSQFNKPPINMYGPNMLNSKEQEDLINEIADSIYEIVCAKYPNEASKITGMIKEKGYEKMNMLLSKQEDLNEIIDKAYEMINNSRKKSNNEDSNDNK